MSEEEKQNTGSPSLERTVKPVKPTAEPHSYQEAIPAIAAEVNEVAVQPRDSGLTVRLKSHWTMKMKDCSPKRGRWSLATGMYVDRFAATGDSDADNRIVSSDHSQ